MIRFQLTYLLGFICLIPCMPILYFHGRRVKQTMPNLPMAEGPQGQAGQGDPALRLLAVGESTIAGVGVDTHQLGITGQMAQKLSQHFGRAVQWKVFAHTGYTARVAREKLVPNIPDAPVDLVVIGLGGNDAFELNSPLRWRRDFEALIASIRQKIPNCPILIANMPPSGEFPAFTGLMKFIFRNLIHLFDQSLKAMTAELDEVYYVGNEIKVDEWIERIGGNVDIYDFFSDGVHPSPLTYRLWGEELAHYVFENRLL
ncbi:MAG: SGNH/GDSL hydrolase family protein [Bacteroidota bacterium]